MKMLSVIVLFFALMACESENAAPQEKTLVGKWEWVVSTGGIAGMTIKASENNRKQLLFTTDGDFEMFENGKSKIKTKYQIKDGKSITSTELVPMIYFLPDSTYWHQSYQLKGDSLFLFDEVYDGFGHTYVRTK